jgi:hypothetical protein
VFRLWGTPGGRLFDVDRKMVAAKAIVSDRLKRAPLASLADA